MTEVGPSSRPRSWAEDLNSYRASRGSRSLSTLDQAGGAPPRYCRTNYVPFCDTKHPLVPYNDFADGQGTIIRVDPRIASERFARHGWGDTSLLKEDRGQQQDRSGANPAQQQRAGGGKACPSSPRGKDGRNGLFGVLQMTEAGGLDSWIGHPLVEPTKGKRALAPPPDPKGRRDLFDVLHVRNPGAPADDSWLGHAKIDPAKGKGVAPGPEQTRGRRDLSDVFTMSILSDPRRLELLQKGADPLGDAWCGHRLIDPARGKQTVSGVPASEDHLSGATFRPGAAPQDVPRRHTKPVAAPSASAGCMDQIMAGNSAGGDDWGRPGKKAVGDMPRPNAYDGRKDLYAHMSYRPLSTTEQSKYAAAMDDGGSTGRKRVAMPGAADPAKGPDMLAWRPEVRVPQFVPRGGMAQENRVKGSTLRGGLGV